VNYLMWRTSASVADLLTKKVRNRHLEFSKIISGRKSHESRWQECVEVVLENLPIATSALYVKNFFKKESRDIALELVDALKNEFKNILEAVDWMDNSTREAALEKADKMVAHIGYPDELMDNFKLVRYYKGLALDELKYLESVLNISKFDSQNMLKKLRKPVNKTDWESHANVALVNAFYNPQENSIREFF
jgi:neprilysin